MIRRSLALGLAAAALAVGALCASTGHADGFADLANGLGLTPEYVGQEMARQSAARETAGQLPAPGAKLEVTEAERAKLSSLAELACTRAGRSGLIHTWNHELIVEGGSGGKDCATKPIHLHYKVSALSSTYFDLTIEAAPGRRVTAQLIETNVVPPGVGSPVDTAIPMGTDTRAVQAALARSLAFWMAYPVGK